MVYIIDSVDPLRMWLNTVRMHRCLTLQHAVMEANTDRAYTVDNAIVMAATLVDKLSTNIHTYGNLPMCGVTVLVQGFIHNLEFPLEVQKQCSTYTNRTFGYFMSVVQV